MKRRKSVRLCLTVGMVLIVACVLVVAIVYIFGGKVKIDNKSYANNEVDTFFVCESSMRYPIFSDTNSLSDNIVVNLFFKGSYINVIGLIYTQVYDSASDAGKAEAALQAEYNIKAAEAGFMNNDVLNRKFTKYNNQLSMSLYAEEKEITDKAAPFLLINNSHETIEDMTKEDYLDNYAEQGFVCNEKQKNNLKEENE